MPDQMSPHDRTGEKRHGLFREISDCSQYQNLLSNSRVSAKGVKWQQQEKEQRRAQT
jgi:hypothetical protein